MRARRPPATPTQELASRGFAAQDHRASVARSYRRVDRGETVAVCAGCACELDGEPVAHDPRCAGGGGVIVELGPVAGGA